MKTFSKNFMANVFDDFTNNITGNVLCDLKVFSFASDNIYIISSIVDKAFTLDSAKYKRIIDTFILLGYKCDQYESPKEIKGKGAFVYFDSDFYFSDDIKEYLKQLNKKCHGYITNEKNCDNSCDILSHSPILTTNYSTFQINLMERI